MDELRNEVLFVLGDLKKNYKRVTYGKILKEYEEIFGRKPDYGELSNELEELIGEGKIKKRLGVYYGLSGIKEVPVPEKPSMRDKIYLLGRFLKDRLLGKKCKYPEQYWKLDYYMEHWGGYTQ